MTLYTYVHMHVKTNFVRTSQSEKEVLATYCVWLLSSLVSCSHTMSIVLNPMDSYKVDHTNVTHVQSQHV